RENINNARDLRNANYFSIGNVSDVSPADKRQQVMFAHRIELDVFYENDLACFGAEDCAIDDLSEVLAVSIREKLKRTRGPGRCSEQPFALRIFADRLQQIAESFFHSRQLRCAAFWNAADAAFGRLQFRLAVV